MKTLLMVLGAVIAIAPAQAQKRKPEADGLQTNESAAANVVKPDTGDGAVAPPNDDLIEERLAENERKLSKVRKRQIQQMRKILQKNPLYKKKNDLLFRIAEKEWDEAKYQYFLQRKEYDKKYSAFLNGTLKKEPVEPVADYSKALTEYRALLKQFPNYKRIDEVMFYLGRGLIAAGKKTRKQGASYMLRLTREYPKSKYATRAFLAVAEFYFDRDLLVAAKVNYEKVLEDKSSGEYAYALYKLGYVHYNLQAFEDAIKAFQGVVKSSSDTGDKRKVYFTNQAYSGLTMSFAEVDDGWKRARDYFREKGGDELATGQLERIARIYNKQDKTDNEIAVYEYLISAKKQGNKVPEYGGYITASYKKLENLEQTDKTINRFFEYFDEKGSWYAVNKDHEEAMIRSKQYREEQLDWLIGKYHSSAQEVEKLKDQARADQLYAKAATYYEKFLQWFPNDKDNYEKEFYLAEIYFFQTREWDKAAEHYKGVYTRDPKGKYSVESAYAVILCKEEKMADAGLIDRPRRQGKGKKKGKAKKAEVVYTKRNKDETFEPVKKQEMQATETEFLQACTEFLEAYPKNGDVPAVAFRAAEIFIRKGHYAEGIKRLEVIMEHHTKHRFAGFAAATLFDANYRLKRWDQMERWGRYMLDSKNYKVLSKKQLLDVIAVSINEYATELNKKGEKDKAAQQMLRFVKEFPKHEKAPIALFNAAAISEQAEKTEEAVDLYESLIKRYKKSPQATEAHFVLGALYESQTEFERAASYFEKMASFPDVPQVADALYNAGAIRAALEQHDQAIEIFETYVKKFPAEKDSPKMLLRVAEFHEKEGRWAPAAKTYDRYIKKYGKQFPETLVDAYLRKAKLFKKEGKRNARSRASRELGLALKSYKRLSDELKKNPYARRNAAEARFLQAEYVHDDYEAVKLSFPMPTLRRALVKKGKLLQKVEKMYFDVLEYKAHDVAAGALFRIGENYQVFAQSLFDLPMPKGLSEDEEIVYRAELDDVAAPLQEKAIEAMQRALQLAHKNHVYNEWSARSATLLVKLSPESFPVLSDKVVNTNWPVASTFSTTYIKDPAGKLEQMTEKKAEKKVEKPAADAGGKATDAKAAGADKSAPAAKAAKDDKKVAPKADPKVKGDK